MKEVVFEINYYFTTVQAQAQALGIKKKEDPLWSILEQFVRRMCYFVGSNAYKLARITKPTASSAEKTESDMIEELILNSHLLSGGIENKYLGALSDHALGEIRSLAKLAQDNSVEQFLGENKRVEDREHEVLIAVLDKGKNQAVDLMLEYLQKQLERKIPMVPYARLGGPNGLSLTRAAFSLILKFSEYFEDFLLMVDMIELRADEMTPEKKDAVM